MGGVSRKHGIRVLGINPGQIVTERPEPCSEFSLKKNLVTLSAGRKWDPNYPPGQVEHIADASASCERFVIKYNGDDHHDRRRHCARWTRFQDITDWTCLRPANEIKRKEN